MTDAGRALPWADVCTITSAPAPRLTAVATASSSSTSVFRSSHGPTVTVRLATSTRVANLRSSPPARLSPRRCPTVTNSTAVTDPTREPSESTTVPGCNSMRSARKDSLPSARVMKQTSWLSGFAAVRSPRSAAISRTRPLVRCPIGNMTRASDSPIRGCSTYDWSLVVSAPRPIRNEPSSTRTTRA